MHAAGSGIRAVGLLSGGLDSTLAARLMLEQGIEVHAVNFVSPFCTCTPKKAGCAAVVTAVRQLGDIPLRRIVLGQEYLDMVSSPRHGYGSGMNPCIDCRTMKLSKAGEYMRSVSASFLFTGEVLGQRPNSQFRRALEIIDRDSGFGGYVLRPLSALNLETTVPERKGWVDRRKLLGLSGRSRKSQMSLAAGKGITRYPCPAGGCLLTDRNFARKLSDHLAFNERLAVSDVAYLKLGRHFRLPGGEKVIVGRNERECRRMKIVRREEDHLLEPVGFSGPTVIVRGTALGAGVEKMLAYTRKPVGPGPRVAHTQGGLRRILPLGSLRERTGSGRAVRKPRVVVGLSGGVDSSVAAALLKQRGYDVTGVIMEIYDGAGCGSAAGSPGGGSTGHACYGPGEKEDVRRAASVCEKLDIPLNRIDLRREYRGQVIEYVRAQYLSGRTPNPCVRCNKLLKFGFLIDRLREQGLEFDYFATGHYARIVERGGRYLLKRAADLFKDQTYFLYTLGQEQLSRTLFPLGDYTKGQVRAMAAAFRLDTADREESQDFIEGGSHAALFEPEELSGGEIVGPGGKVLGKHRGIVHYTVGQRRGLGVSWRRPLYVTGIDAGSNRIMVGEKGDLMAGGLVAADVHYPFSPGPKSPFRATARIRFRHPGAEATVHPREDGTAQVLFDRPQTAVAPGQSVVFYDRSLLLGGGIIREAVSVEHSLYRR